jgi:hypothetical protein
MFHVNLILLRDKNVLSDRFRSCMFLIEHIRHLFCEWFVQKKSMLFQDNNLQLAHF